MDDQELLREYVGRRSDRAFAELTKRYLPFVYSTALRLTSDPHTAEEVTQTVFIQFARKAETVREGHALPGWLYRATQRVFLMNRRAEGRRLQCETEAVNLAEQNEDPAPAATPIEPMLDDAFRRLNQVEQEAVFMRFFHNKSFLEVGTSLGLNEDAARKRINRSLMKMRGYFARAGVTTTMALLSSVMAAQRNGTLANRENGDTDIGQIKVSSASLSRQPNQPGEDLSSVGTTDDQTLD